MAPERFSGDEVTYRADIYSLACVLAECLTGSPPYRANSIEQAVGAHLTQPPPRPSQLRPGQVPAALDEVVAGGMAKNPQERYRSAGELAAAAHHALTESGQHQATSILRQGERTARPTSAAETMGGRMPSGGIDDATRARAWSRAPNPATQSGWAPAPAAGTGSWRGQPGTPPPVGPAGAPDFGRVPGTDDQRKRQVLIGGAAVLVVAVIAALLYLVLRPGPSSTSASSESGQTVLPFNGINFRLSPSGVALDTDGNLYVTSQGLYGKVVKLAPGSDAPTVLPFSGLYQPQALAVDSFGAVYVTDFNNRAVKLAAGSNQQVVLPINGLNYPEGVAVDTAGNVYVADRGNSRVVKLAARSNEQTDLPFTGLKNPDGVAVDGAGSVYVADTDNSRVVKLEAGSNQQTVLPITGLNVPWGIAVDTAGNVYVTGHNTNKVVKSAAGSSAPAELPFTGLNTPLAVAVDKDGNVYVADRGNNRVVKLAVG
jgi:serine/threonine-protein kinase